MAPCVRAVRAKDAIPQGTSIVSAFPRQPRTTNPLRPFVDGLRSNTLHDELRTPRIPKRSRLSSVTSIEPERTRSMIVMGSPSIVCRVSSSSASRPARYASHKHVRAASSYPSPCVCFSRPQDGGFASAAVGMALGGGRLLDVDETDSSPPRGRVFDFVQPEARATRTTHANSIATKARRRKRIVMLRVEYSALASRATCKATISRGRSGAWFVSNERVTACRSGR